MNVKQDWKSLLIITPSFLIGIFLINSAFLTWKDYRLYQEQGQSVVAEIIDREILTDEWRGQTQTKYQLTYRFSVNGQVYRRQETVDSGVYRRYRNAIQLNVTYLTSDPDSSILTETHTIEATLIMFGFALFWNFFPFMVIYKFLRSFG